MNTKQEVDVSGLKEWLRMLSGGGNRTDDMANFGDLALKAMPELLRVYEAWQTGAAGEVRYDHERTLIAEFDAPCPWKFGQRVRIVVPRTA